MAQYQWIWQLTAGGALIFFFYLLLRFITGKISDALNGLEDTLRDIEKSMINRDQIILNHLEHFVEEQKEASQNQLAITKILRKVCHELDINGGI